MKKGILILICMFLVGLVATMPLTFAATQNLVYDANGNLVTGDGKYREYDGFNKLVRVRDGNVAGGNILENYTWHPTEDRVLIKHLYNNSEWNESVYYISKTFVRVKNASGTFDTKYVYHGGQLVAQENYDGSKIFLHADHLGSVSVVTNESGALVEETTYSPFGEIITGGATSRFDYEGKEYDSVVGDYDFHARRVKPEWGKFTQPDTIIQDVYDPQSLNRYAFERNSPYKYVDESGNSITTAIILIIGTILIVGVIGLTVYELIKFYGRGGKFVGKGIDTDLGKTSAPDYPSQLEMRDTPQDDADLADDEITEEKESKLKDLEDLKMIHGPGLTDPWLKDEIARLGLSAEEYFELQKTMASKDVKIQPKDPSQCRGHPCADACPFYPCSYTVETPDGGIIKYTRVDKDKWTDETLV